MATFQHHHSQQMVFSLITSPSQAIFIVSSVWFLTGKKLKRSLNCHIRRNINHGSMVNHGQPWLNHG